VRQRGASSDRRPSSGRARRRPEDSLPLAHRSRRPNDSALIRRTSDVGWSPTSKSTNEVPSWGGADEGLGAVEEGCSLTTPSSPRLLPSSREPTLRGDPGRTGTRRQTAVAEQSDETQCAGWSARSALDAAAPPRRLGYFRIFSCRRTSCCRPCT
jgi:hypothetical protein